MSSEAQNPQPVTPETTPPAAPTSRLRRSPGLALVLSFFPGLGHLYLGLYQRAFAIFLAFAVAIWLAEHAHIGILVAFVWFFAVIDGYRQAQCLNLGICEEPKAAFGTTTKTAWRGSLALGIAVLLIGLVLLYNQFYPIDFSFLENWWPLIIVLAGVYLVAAHLIERQKQRARELSPGEIPPQS
jgi:hypothetical protein